MKKRTSTSSGRKKKKAKVGADDWAKGKTKADGTWGGRSPARTANARAAALIRLAMT